MTRRWARLAVVLAPMMGWVGVTGSPTEAAPGLAALAAPGFDTVLTDLPGRFTAGATPITLAAVVSTTEDGGCRKVRWSMVLRVAGMRLDQVRMDRIEESGEFPTRIRTEGRTARITDARLDPGTLCPGRTVTARYRLAFAPEVVDARVELRVEAYDERLRLLSQGSATREVIRGAAEPSAVPEETPEPTAEPTGVGTTAPEEPTATLPDEPVATGPAAGGLGGGSGRRTGAGPGGVGLVQVGFLLGGLLLFLGVGLLVRMRHLLGVPTDAVAVPGAAGGLRPDRPAPGRVRGPSRSGSTRSSAAG